MDTQKYDELTPDFKGRVLTCRVSLGYDQLARLLEEGETLYVLHDQEIKKVPVPVFNQADLDATIASHNQGMSFSYEIVAAPTPAPCADDIIMMVIIVDGEGGLFGGFSVS